LRLEVTAWTGECGHSSQNTEVCAAIYKICCKILAGIKVNLLLQDIKRPLITTHPPIFSALPTALQCERTNLSHERKKNNLPRKEKKNIELMHIVFHNQREPFKPSSVCLKT
jgi:hypothetical protein